MEELLFDITLAEKEIVDESLNAVRPIADRQVKTKAYYNALAANSVINYLKQKGLINGDIYNLHDSAKMLADFEIADIQLPNLHIDVRAVFDEEEIFIPKKHFYNNVLPDVYLILKLDESLNSATMLGLVEPSKINKQNENDEYYFVNKSFLTPASELKNMILSAPEKTQYMITDVTEVSIEKLIMLYMDHDLDNSKLEKLLDYLKHSAVAREKLVEFENFERLSSLALKEFKDLDIEKNDFTQYIKTLVTTDEFAEFDHQDELSVLFNEEQAPASSGLFIDDEPAVAEEDEPAAQTEEEVYDEAEVLATDSEEEAEEDETAGVEDFVDTDSAVEEIIEDSPLDEVFEEVPAEEELSDVVEPETEEITVEQEPAAPVDEFEAFEAADEFEQAETPESETVEAPVEEHELILDSDELAIEPGDVLNIEFSESLETHAVDEIEETPELHEEALTGADLEFQIDGLENISEELSVENVEPEEVNFDTEEPVAEVEEPDVPAVDFEDPAAEEFLTEEEPVVEETAEETDLPMFDLEGLEFDSEEVIEPVEEQPAAVSDVVESVSDEDVDNAIALSALDDMEQAAEEAEPTEPVHEPVDEISNDAESENGEFSLDELLSIENDLTAAPDEAPKAPAGFKFDDDEDVTAPVASAASAVSSASEEDLAFLAADLDEDEAMGEETEPEFVDNTDSENDLEMSEETDEIPSDEDEGTDFAFAVDSKPNNKKLIAPIAGLIAVIGLAGVGAWYFLFNGKSNNNIGLVDDLKNNTSVGDVSLDVNTDPVADLAGGNDPVADIQIPAETAPAKPEDKKPQEAQPAPVAKDTSQKADTKADAKAQTPADVKPLPEPLTLQKIKKDFSQPNTYLSVSKIVWDVPEYLTYNDDFSGYLQTLGSTLKLNLSGDLLLLSENTVFDKIRVRVELKDSGKKFSAEITDGCGTKSVDDLVLQSVKNTLNLLKPPVNSLDTADENLYITIYL